MEFRPALIHDSEIPLYRQLFEQIASKIRSGELARGERLPATRELAGLLGLNRTTVSAAYALLDHMIGVDEREAQPHPQAPAHCGFSGAGQADECDRHARLATLARQRAALRSVIIFGVMKTSISVLLTERVRVRNRAPR